MSKVSVPDGPRTFTSGKSFDSTFRVNIESQNLDNFDSVVLEAELTDFEGEYTDLNSVVPTTLVSTADEVPASYPLPENAGTRLQLGLEVHRGPLHPHEITTLQLEITVFGVKDEDREFIGYDEIELRG